MVIFNKVYSDGNSIVKAKLDRGDKVMAAMGVMVAMDNCFDVAGKTGGIKKAIGRMFSSQSTFLSEYTAKKEGEIIFSPKYLGDIEILDIREGEEYTLGQNAFLCYCGNIDLTPRGKGTKGILSGEGLFQVDVRGNGTLVLSAYGKIIKKFIEPGEKFIVDTNHIVLRNSNMEYSVQLISNGMTSLVTGEGYIMKFTGPGEVWYQSKNPSYLVAPPS